MSDINVKAGCVSYSCQLLYKILSVGLLIINNDAYTGMKTWVNLHVMTIFAFRLTLLLLYNCRAKLASRGWLCMAECLVI